MEKFETTEDDLENEFNPQRRRLRLSKDQQIYGMWADSDVDSDEEPRRSGFDTRKNHTTPVNFVLSGTGKKLVETNGEMASESDSSSKEEATSVTNPPALFETQKQNFAGCEAQKKEDFGGFEKHTKGFGGKYMMEWGYQLGKGLGKDLQGITNPIEAKLRKGRGAIGFYSSEKTSSKEKPVFRREKPAGQWKKKQEAAKKNSRFVYKTPEEVIAESTGRRLPGSKSMSNVKVIDLTGPEPQVLDGYHAIHQHVIQPKDYDDDEAARQFRCLELPELTHNLDLLLNMTEQEIIQNDREIKHEKDMEITIQHEEEELGKIIDQEKKEFGTTEKILEVVESLEERSVEGCENPLTLAECATIFRKLREEFYDECKLYELVGVVCSVMNSFLKNWRPLKDSKYALDVFQEWKDILDTNSADFGRKEPYRQLFCNTWLPLVQQAIGNWNCRKCIPLIDLLENWLPLIPSGCLDYILDQMVFPKLQEELEDWDPLQDPIYVHLWLHPWLPLMGSRLEPLHALILEKLCEVVDIWRPCNDSVLGILQPWKGVFPDGRMEMFIINNVMPRLRLCLRDFDINPHDQKLEPWDWVMAWEDFFPLKSLVLLLDEEFFPKWLKVLCVLLGHRIPPNYDEVTKWYHGWKSMFSEELLANPTVKERFNQALLLMQRSVDYQSTTSDLVEYLASLERQREDEATRARKSEAIRRCIRNTTGSSENVTPSYKDLIERKANELGIIFMPVANRYYEAKQVHRFGRVLLYIDRKVIFMLSGSRWMPTSLQALLDMAQ